MRLQGLVSVSRGNVVQLQERVENYRAFSTDVTAATLVFQTSPLGVELFSYVKAFFCSHKFAQMRAT